MQPKYAHSSYFEYYKGRISNQQGKKYGFGAIIPNIWKKLKLDFLFYIQISSWWKKNCMYSNKIREIVRRWCGIIFKKILAQKSSRTVTPNP